MDALQRKKRNMKNEKKREKGERVKGAGQKTLIGQLHVSIQSRKVENKEKLALEVWVNKLASNA